MKTNRTLSLLTLAALLAAGGAPFAGAQDQQRQQEQDRERIQTQEQVYGWEMMTEQERLEYRERLRSMNSEEERERFRYEHRLRMEERARTMGVDKPAAPGGKSLKKPAGGPGGKHN